MPHAQRKSVHTHPHAESEDPSHVDLQPILQAAIADAGWKQSALARELDKPESYLSMQLSGQRPLSLDQLEDFPPEILRAFLLRLNRDVLGSVETLLEAAETFSAAARDAVRVLRVISPDMHVRNRMAKADHR